jgi:hypothetical protein
MEVVTIGWEVIRIDDEDIQCELAKLRNVHCNVSINSQFIVELWQFKQNHIREALITCWNREIP